MSDWVIVLGLLAAGLFFSAFFSGSETGFYRVTRLRLVLDALGGDWLASALLWLTNNPSLFVATTLIGNNFANNLTSLALVLGVQLVVASNPTVEMLVSIAAAPVIFVYGELLPKNLFLYAPNALLRRAGPLFLLCALLFLPVSLLLWLLGRTLEWLVGESPEHVRLVLARQELRDAFAEGHAAGILEPTQRQIAQTLFAPATPKALPYAKPITRVTRIRGETPASEALRIARRHRAAMLLISEEGGRLAGYVRVVDLQLHRPTRTDEALRPLLRVSADATLLAALQQMQSADENLLLLATFDDEPLGLLSREDAVQAMLRGE